MTYPATTFEEAVDLTITAANQQYQVINGSATEQVQVEDGSYIPTIRKAIVDNLYFKSPVAWSTGTNETVFNQLRSFPDPVSGQVSWWYAPNATNSNPILMPANPSTSPSWVVYGLTNNTLYQVQKRLAAEAGYNLVGTFFLGCTLSSATEVVLNEFSGEYYSWDGTFPKNVSTGSTPTPLGSGGWIDRSDVTLRSELTTAGSSISDIANQKSILESTSGADTVGANSGLTVQGEIDAARVRENKSTLSRIKARQQAANSPWGQAGPINVLGDSITFGYFASYEGGVGGVGGMFYNRWASLLARSLSHELGTGHYITCNPNFYQYGVDTDIPVRLAQVGSWVASNSGEYTSNLYVGQASTTTAVGDYFEWKIPATFKECYIYYVTQPGGGEITIYQNGVTDSVINCNVGTSIKQAVKRIIVTSNPQGYCILRIAKTGSGAGTVGISAISPSQGVQENGTQLGGGLNLFAAPGRRLQDVSEQVINDSCNNAAGLIMALGFNDNPLNGSGQGVGRAAFTQRIDWLIQYCNQYNTPLIVPDFSWKNTASSFTRSELKRLATATGGIYIPLPDMIKSGSFPTEAERLATGMWQDAAHPNRSGHKWIFETLAKTLGLAVSSKIDAISNHDYWISLPLTTTYANIQVNIMRNIGAYKMCSDGIQLRGQLKLASGANWPSGLTTPCGTEVNSMFHIAPPVKFNSFIITKTFEIDAATGEVRGLMGLGGTGGNQGLLRAVRPASVAAAVSFNGSSMLEIDRWEAYGND